MMEKINKEPKNHGITNRLLWLFIFLHFIFLGETNNDNIMLGRWVIQEPDVWCNRCPYITFYDNDTCIIDYGVKFDTLLYKFETDYLKIGVDSFSIDRHLNKNGWDELYLKHDSIIQYIFIKE